MIGAALVLASLFLNENSAPVRSFPVDNIIAFCLKELELLIIQAMGPSQPLL